MNKEIIFFGLLFLTDDFQNLNFQTKKKIFKQLYT